MSRLEQGARAVIKRLLNLLLDLIDSGSAPGKPRKRQLSYHLLIEHARRVLGVKEWTELRQTLLARNVQQSV